ncbi:MAG TPA: pseudouridine-5'-phosphate glycosidase [Anaerolineales bacterium]|nr:pseudouridine-5'-phosphate glycosidase [Anaerolineales bacterium]
MIKISPEVVQAINKQDPIVALESTVITHGLPYPENLKIAIDMEKEIRGQGAVPATIAALRGEILVGMNSEQLEALVMEKDFIKLSVRDISEAIVKRKSGGTPVAATLFLGYRAGLRVFATGGIGGVHRGESIDISSDLIQLSRTPMVVVCAGAKAILDLPATLELLETLGIPVIGYQTNEFPAFYSRSSGLKVSVRAESAEEIAEIARVHWELGMQSAVLVVQPLADKLAIPYDEVQVAIDQAVNEATVKGIRGQKVTPYLLGRVSELTGGKSLEANLALLINNARLAAKIAAALH